MKKFVLFSNVVIWSFISLLSCSKKDSNSYPESERVYYSYGTLTTDNGVKVMTDKGNTLNITDNFFDYTRYNNKRVILTYSILSSVETVFQVKTYTIDSILTKSILNNETLTPKQQDSLGNSPIWVRYARFSGKYLMIEFNYKKRDYTTVHFINAVYDPTKSVTGDTLHVIMRHNDYGSDSGSFYPGLAGGFIHFNIDERVPTDKDKLTIKIYNYDNSKPEETSLIGTYKRNTVETSQFESSEKVGTYKNVTY